MEWIAVEQVDDSGARLVALRLADGAQRVLFATELPSPLHASFHPKVVRVALDVPSRGQAGGRPRSRVGLLNLERTGMGWLRQSLDPKWRIGHAVFDDTGTRLAMEGAWDGVPISDIYVYRLTFSGNSVREEALAGAGNPARLGCRQALFVDGGKQLLYLRKGQPEGGFEVGLLDLERSGDSASLLEGRAPSVLALTLTEGAEALPEVRIAWCGAIKQVFWAGLARGGTRQQVRTARVGVRPHTDLGPTHLKIEEICVAHGGELLACSADGQVWLTDVETGASVAIVEAGRGASHRGLAFDEAQGRLLFCTNDASGSRLRALDLGTREVTELVAFGNVSVVALAALPPDPVVSDRLAALTSVEAPGQAAGDATAIQRVPPTADQLGDSLSGDDEGDVLMGHTVPEGAWSEGGDAVEDPTIEQPLERVEAIAAALPTPPPEPVLPPDAQRDFGGWMKHALSLDDPTKALASLEKLRDNSSLREAARLYLGTQRRRAAGREEAPVALLQALVAAGHLHLNEARGELLELCRRGRPKVDDGGLLETDEHFALAALLYIDGHTQRFGWSKVYRDYEGMLVKINEVLEGDGESAASRIMAAFAEGYARQIAGVLQAPDPSAAPALDTRRLREHSLADMAAAATLDEARRRIAEEEEEVEREAERIEAEARAQQAAEEEARRAEDARRAEEEEEEIRALARRQAEEAERRAAEALAEEARREAARKAEEEAREAARRRLAEEEARRKAQEERIWLEQRRRADEEARQKAEEERIWLEQRRRAEEEAARKAEEERTWTAQRQRAEEEARRTAAAADDWQTQRQRAEQAAQAEEERRWQEQRRAAERRDTDEERRAAELKAERARAEAAAKVAAAERAAREAEEALMAAEAAAEAEAAVGTARAPSRAPEARAPEVRPPQSRAPEARAPDPRFSARPAALEDDDLPPTGTFSTGESADLPAAPAPQGAQPLILPIAGLFAAASGLSAIVLGATRLGGLLPVLGVLWLVAGASLFADRRWAWLLALAAFGVNAINLVVVGLGPLPEWLSGGLLVFWGIAAAGMGAALLHPNLRTRFGPNRRRF